MSALNEVYAERRLEMGLASSLLGSYLGGTTCSQDMSVEGELGFTNINSAGLLGGLQYYDLPKTIKPIKQGKGGTMLENVKGYIEKHKDVIFTLGLVILVDHFLFKGALRERIKGTLEGVLKKAESLIEQKKGE